MTTVHQLRANLEAAQAAYLSADIEHPTAVHLAKEALANAWLDYWAACADLVTRLPEAISSQWHDCTGSGDIKEIYTEITGRLCP